MWKFPRSSIILLMTCSWGLHPPVHSHWTHPSVFVSGRWPWTGHYSGGVEAFIEMVKLQGKSVKQQGQSRAISFSHCYLCKLAWNLFLCLLHFQKLCHYDSSYYLAIHENLHRFLNHFFPHLQVENANCSPKAVFLFFHSGWIHGYSARDYFSLTPLQPGMAMWLHPCQVNVSDALNFQVLDLNIAYALLCAFFPSRNLELHRPGTRL